MIYEYFVVCVMFWTLAWIGKHKSLQNFCKETLFENHHMEECSGDVKVAGVRNVNCIEMSTVRSTDIYLL
jgi:hypothetical protein